MATNRETFEERVASELTPVDVEQRLRDELDELYDFSDVGGPFAHMQPSRVLEEMDPVAFRCAVADMSDDDTVVEIEGESYDRREVERLRDEYDAETDDETEE